MNLLDYIYYRIYYWYRSFNDPVSKETAIILVSLMVFFILFDVYVILDTIFFYYQNISKWVAVPVLLFSFIFFYYRYTKIIKIDTCVKLWGKEEKLSKKRNGYLIFIFILTIILLPMIIGFLRHNLHWNI